MLVTAELRLWWSRCPDEVAGLFAGSAAEERVDVYLRDPAQQELGAKRRAMGAGAGATELKLLVSRFGRLRVGQGEMWVKACSAALDLGNSPTVAVRKLRRQRLFHARGGRIDEIAGQAPPDDEGESCAVEFTEVLRQGDPQRWWTLGFEASGAIDGIESMLARTVDLLTPQLSDQCLEAAKEGGYPKWLSGFGEERR